MPTQTFSSKRSAFAFKNQLNFDIVENSVCFATAFHFAPCRQMHFALFAHFLFSVALPFSLAREGIAIANIITAVHAIPALILAQARIACDTSAHFAKVCSACENLQTESVLIQLLVREFAHFWSLFTNRLLHVSRMFNYCHQISMP